MGKSPLKYDFLLLLTSAIWGFAFVAQRAGMEYLGPLTFNGIRFALGSLALLPAMILQRKAYLNKSSAFEDRKLFLAGLAAGILVFAGASFQQIGIVYTTAGKAGFITGLYVVIVPFLGLAWKQRTPFLTWIASFLALTGLYFLSVKGNFHMEKGDFLVLISAFFWAVHVQFIAKFSPQMNPLELSFLQFATCSLLSLLSGFTLEKPQIEEIFSASIPLLYAGLLSVGIGYTLQVIAQQKSPPSHTAIILSLESVFAVIGGALILDENLTTRELLGCILMLAGMILSQLTRRTKEGI